MLSVNEARRYYESSLSCYPARLDQTKHEKLADRPPRVLVPIQPYSNRGLQSRRLVHESEIPIEAYVEILTVFIRMRIEAHYSHSIS